MGGNKIDSIKFLGCNKSYEQGHEVKFQLIRNMKYDRKSLVYNFARQFSALKAN